MSKTTRRDSFSLLGAPTLAVTSTSIILKALREHHPLRPASAPGVAVRAAAGVSP